MSQTQNSLVSGFVLGSPHTLSVVPWVLYLDGFETLLTSLKCLHFLKSLSVKAYPWFSPIPLYLHFINSIYQKWNCIFWSCYHKNLVFFILYFHSCTSFSVEPLDGIIGYSWDCFKIEEYVLERCFVNDKIITLNMTHLYFGKYSWGNYMHDLCNKADLGLDTGC